MLIITRIQFWMEVYMMGCNHERFVYHVFPRAFCSGKILLPCMLTHLNENENVDAE